MSSIAQPLPHKAYREYFRLQDKYPYAHAKYIAKRDAAKRIGTDNYKRHVVFGNPLDLPPDDSLLQTLFKEARDEFEYYLREQGEVLTGDYIGPID
tara:strand:+ start:40 stop:327 length:288 start_codon:yes stop_codon:yes gene_type:complete